MPEEYGSVTPRAAAVATAASTALPPSRSTSMPAAEASASTLATAPPYPTATGTFVTGALPAEGGAAAPTVTTAAETARTDSFRATGRPIRTSSPGTSAQRNQNRGAPTATFRALSYDRHTSNTGTSPPSSPASMRAHERRRAQHRPGRGRRRHQCRARLAGPHLPVE